MPAGAVFLSYASEDGAAAERIANALRSAGVEVWFDKSELRGGDAWDRQIRKQIQDCALFIAIVSQHTQQRLEGYFRHEWKLAIERAHHMAEQKAFLLPIVVDATSDQDAITPDLFKEVQWTWLPGGNTRPEFVTRVQQLLSGGYGHSRTSAWTSAAVRSARLSRLQLASLAVAVVMAGSAAYLLTEKPWTVESVPPTKSTTSADTPKPFNPPPHSIAVLPFVNLSGDKEQEYFSDGLTEELLNSLTDIEGLQVAARTSSFSFREHPDAATVAHKLNVGTLLEGSVRRSGHTVRVTVQLINAVTGFHLWSKIYDRDLGDVLKLQTEIATAVATALQVTLLGDVGTKIELGGTRNPAAFDAYLRALRLTRAITNPRDDYQPVAAYSEAIRLDPNYALAFAARSMALSNWLANYGHLTNPEELTKRVRADAERAITLAPTLGEAHLALGSLLETTLDFARAGDEYERARALAPGNAAVGSAYALHAAYMGHSAAALVAAQRSVSLDPLNPLSHRALGDVHWHAHRYDESIAAYADAIAVDPVPAPPYARRGLSYYVLGNFQMARSSCEMNSNHWESWVCLALTYEKLGQHREAEAQIPRLVQFNGDAFAYQFAQIYAQWGNSGKALDWLETALRLRDAGLRRLKTDPLMDPMRNEPRFQAAMRELKFAQ